MINRSAIKYRLKKVLPRFIFSFIMYTWRNILLTIVEQIDSLRLRKFTKKTCVHLSHNNKEFSLYISPANGFIDKHIFLYGVYEPFMLDLFQKHLHEGDTFVDIGANIGQHSMFSACLVGKTGKVLSFEPIPAIFNQLKESVTSNHFESTIHPYNFALGSSVKEEKLLISKNVGGSSFVNTDDTQEVITVHIKKGDSVLHDMESIDVVKIDVEGYEYEVLTGMEATLTKHAPILFLEFSGGFYHKQKENNGAKILNILRRHNYKLFNIEDDMKEVTDDVVFLSLFQNKKLEQTNLFCTSK